LSLNDSIIGIVVVESVDVVCPLLHEFKRIGVREILPSDVVSGRDVVLLQVVLESPYERIRMIHVHNGYRVVSVYFRQT
jgi:hypothetical protein